MESLRIAHLNHKSPLRLPPIIKYLTSKNMSSYAPHALISTLGKPLMAQQLRIEIMHLKRAMMHMTYRIRSHEESVMIHIIKPTINMRKERYILLALRSVLLFRINIQPVTRHEIEIFRVELPLRIEILYAEPVMAQLVHCCGSLFEALELVHAVFVGFEIID